MKTSCYPSTLLTVCVLNAGFILYVSTLQYGGAGAGDWVIGAFISCCLAPVLTIVGLVSALVALSSKKPSGLLWLATAIAAGSGIFILMKR